MILDLFNYFHRPSGIVARYCQRQHFWEVGMRGFRVRDVTARMSRYFDVVQAYRNRDWNPSQNFVLRSRHGRDPARARERGCASNVMSDTTAHELTTRDHWDSAWERPPRWRLPSKLFVSTRNLQRVIAPHVRPGMRYLELGCAPGKMLAWVASDLGARVSGLDYSERGIEWARRLFDTLGLEADLRCEDVWSTTFDRGGFDVVFSAGLIEHFDDPSALVRQHVTLVKPGGRAIITVPNYGGIYGRLQGWFDPDNLALHNLSIMSTEAMRASGAGRSRRRRACLSGRPHLPVGDQHRSALAGADRHRSRVCGKRHWPDSADGRGRGVPAARSRDRPGRRARVLTIVYSFNKRGLEAGYWLREIAAASNDQFRFVPFNHDPFLSPSLYIRGQLLDNLYD